MTEKMRPLTDHEFNMLDWMLAAYEKQVLDGFMQPSAKAAAMASAGNLVKQLKAGGQLPAR